METLSPFFGRGSEIQCELTVSNKNFYVSSSGQMQDLIAVGNGRPALLKSDAILYTDTRAVKQAQDLSSKLSTPVLASSLLAKLKLLPSPSLENRETSYKLLFGAADYMAYMFTDGASGVCTDATTVSTTGLSVGPEHREYDIDTLRRVGLEAFVPLFPQILERTGRVGSLSEKVARDIGAEDLIGIDVIHAGGDAFSATAGVNCATLGSGSYLYAGTTGWIAATVSVEESRSASVRGSLFHLGHGASRNVILAASVASVGSALEYVGREILGCTVQELTELAAESVIGSHGVVMCTYLNGRRCPRPVDQSRGVLFGMQMSTRRCDIARAAVEGVVFSLAEAYKEMPAGTTQATVRVVGGVSRCSIMLEGISALIGTAEVRAGNDMEAGLLGAGATAEGCDERGKAATAAGRLVDVDDKSRREWHEAMRRWQRVVASSEPLWG